MRASVVYRDGPLTVEDYTEAIEGLTAARACLEKGRWTYCPICHDTGHIARTCHHNPLVLARRYAHDMIHWRCFHCGAEFTRDQVAEAEEHFGARGSDAPTCVSPEGDEADG